MHILTFLDLLCQNCEGIRKSSPFYTGNVEEETVGPGMFFILPCLNEVRPIMDFLIDFRGPINRAMTSVNSKVPFVYTFIRKRARNST